MDERRALEDEPERGGEQDGDAEADDLRAHAVDDHAAVAERQADARGERGADLGAMTMDPTTMAGASRRRPTVATRTLRSVIA
jgi:hypothetical protein